jgi:hypothetical protein
MNEKDIITKNSLTTPLNYHSCWGGRDPKPISKLVPREGATCGDGARCYSGGEPRCCFGGEPTYCGEGEPKYYGGSEPRCCGRGEPRCCGGEEPTIKANPLAPTSSNTIPIEKTTNKTPHHAIAHMLKKIKTN